MPRRIGCDPAFLALPTLSALASAIGNTRRIRLKRTWEEPCVLWTAIVADSGTRKSPAYQMAVGHLFREQRELLADYQAREKEYRQQLKQLDTAERKAKEPETLGRQEPEKPEAKRIICNDTTIEKLAEILEDNPRGLLMARDELAGWFGSFTRYKGGRGGTDLPNWLEMFNAGTIINDRKTGDRKTILVARAAVSVTGGIQPRTLARTLTPELFESGLPARLLMAMPPRMVKTWDQAEMEVQVEQRYHHLLRALLALDFELHYDGTQAPHSLLLSPGAAVAWARFYDRWAHEQTMAEGEMASALSKLEAYAARLALVHHVVGHVGNGKSDLVPVARDSIEAGITLALWFAAETRRIYAALAESDTDRDARRLLDRLRGQPDQTLTVRDVQRFNNRRYRRAEDAEAALAALVQSGWAVWVEGSPDRKGGLPTRAVRLVEDDDDDSGDTDDGGNRPDVPPPAGPPDGIWDHLDAGGRTEDQPSGPDTGPGQEPEPGVGGVTRHAGPEGASLRQEEEAGPLTGRNGNDAVAVSQNRSPGMPAPPDLGLERPQYQLVQDPAGLDAVTAALRDTPLVALDLETTGLNSGTDRVRLLSLAWDDPAGEQHCAVVDCFIVDPRPVLDVLGDRALVIHNAAFDLAFLARLGFTPAAVHDTLLLAQLLASDRSVPANLAACCERYLGLALDKTEQASDWSGRWCRPSSSMRPATCWCCSPCSRPCTRRSRRPAWPRSRRSSTAACRPWSG